MSKQHGKHDVVIAALWMVGAIVSFTAMAIAGREVSSDLDTFEIMFFRSILGIFIVAGAITAFGKWHEVKTDRLGLHTIRNLSHFTGQNLWFYSLPLIPLAQLIALEFTLPIWVLLLSPLFLGERITRWGAGTAVVGFIGALLVAQPGTGPLSIGIFTAAGAAIGFALSAIFTRRLTRDQSISCILLYLTVMQAIFGAICVALFSDFNYPAPTSIPLVILIGCAGLFAHLCLTTALSLAPASTVMPVDFARLPVIAIIGMVFYQEPFSLMVFAGAVLIFGANYLNIVYGQRA